MSMDIKNVLIPTMVIRPEMCVRDVFTECGERGVHALPYYNKKGKLSGTLTLKNIMKVSCLPDYMVELSSLLGNQMSCVENAEEKALEVICSPVEVYVRKIKQTISSTEPLIKALAMMVKNKTSYVFVVDDCEYKGQLTIQSIARAMSRMDNACVRNEN